MSLNRTKRLIVALLGMMSVVSVSWGQDPLFSQFYANPLYLNPALAGVERCPRFTMNYRNQWGAVNQGEGNYVTYAAGYDQHVNALSGGVGILLMHDREGENGVFKTTRASLIYSYNLNINRKWSVRFGLEGTYWNKSIDWSQLTFGDMIDPRYGFIYNTAETPPNESIDGVDFSAGALAYSKRFYGGFAVHHLTQPEQNFMPGQLNRLNAKFTAHAGLMIPINKRYPEDGAISPNVMYQSQGKATSANPTAQQLFLGVYGYKGPFVGGLWWRTGDAVTALIGLRTDYVRFGYSYDITYSKLSNRTGGTHEVSLALHFNCKPVRKKFRQISCPEF